MANPPSSEIYDKIFERLFGKPNGFNAHVIHWRKNKWWSMVAKEIHEIYRKPVDKPN